MATPKTLGGAARNRTDTPRTRTRSPGIRQDALVVLIEPANSVILVVGREEFTVPTTFAEQIAAATTDCIAVGVRSVDDGPTTVTLVPNATGTALMRLGSFTIETEGHVSVRDVYNREYTALGVDAGPCLVTVWGNDRDEPDELIVEVG